MPGAGRTLSSHRDTRPSPPTQGMVSVPDEAERVVRPTTKSGSSVKRTALETGRFLRIRTCRQLPLTALAMFFGAQACASDDGANKTVGTGPTSTVVPTVVTPGPAGSTTAGPTTSGPTGATAGPAPVAPSTGGPVSPSTPPVNPNPTSSSGVNPQPGTSVAPTTPPVVPEPSVSPTSTSTSTPTDTTTEPGTTPDPTGTDTSSMPVDPTPGNGTALLEEDFESYTTGAPPEGYNLFVGWVYNPTNLSGPEMVEVDGAKAHGGSKSLHIKSVSNPAQLAWDIPPGNRRLYVRSWVYLTNRKLGNNSDGNHETLIALRRDPTSANSEIRFGEIKGAVGTNEVPTDAVSPPVDKWNTGPEIPKGKWVCIEVAFLADLPYHELYAWADGELVHSVTKAADWHAPVPDAWMGTSLAQIVFGWHSFTSFSEELWFDDIVIATDRVGCN